MPYHAVPALVSLFLHPTSADPGELGHSVDMSGTAAPAAAAGAGAGAGAGSGATATESGVMPCRGSAPDPGRELLRLQALGATKLKDFRLVRVSARSARCAPRWGRGGAPYPTFMPRARAPCHVWAISSDCRHGRHGGCVRGGVHQAWRAARRDVRAEGHVQLGRVGRAL